MNKEYRMLKGKMTSEWVKLTPEEKRKERISRWLSPRGAQFIDPDAEKSYKARLTRIIDAIQLKEPDRVPVILPAGIYPAFHAGVTLQTVMYDYNELRKAWRKFLHEFNGDTHASPAVIPPGRVSDILDSRTSKWPGHGLPDDARMFQFVEGEYMKADEYDALINDPSDFFLRIFLPRVFGQLKPIQKLTPLTHSLGMPTAFLGSYTNADVRSAFQAILDAGRELEKWREVIGDFNREAVNMGFPALRGGFTMAPFDTIGDTLRGTQGVFRDMFQQPDKLHEAMEKIVPLNIEAAVSMADAVEGPIIFMPLHKGDDVFMSDKQFETFYWPTFRKVIMGLVEEGCIPLLFAEGRYNRRLEVIKDLPKGTVLWWFDQTDMAKAKEILGITACISGNVPTSLLCTGTPQAVKDYCRKLIEVCAAGGGFILTGGAAIDRGNPDNLHAMVEAVEEFGRYC
jgi:hypothetical protein